MRNFTILALVLVTGITVRLMYILYSGGTMIYEPDSQGYYVEHNFYTQDFLHNFFDKFRTPGYRMITGLVMAVSGNTTPLYGTPEFFSREMPVLYLQTAAGLIGLMFLFDTLKRLRIPTLWNGLFTGFSAVNFYQFMWERAFLTEALFIFILIVSLWAFVRLLEKPAWAMGLVFITVSIFGFLIRPGGTGIPFLTLPFVWLSHRTKKVFVMISLLLLLYTAVPLGYSAMNRILNNYRGVSINTDVAIFGIILTNKLPIGAAAQAAPLLYQQVKDFRAAGGNTSIPWYFMVAHNNDIFDRSPELKAFNRTVVADQLPALIKIAAGEIPIAFWDTYMYEVPYRSDAPGALRTFFDAIDLLVTVIQRGSIIFLVTVPFTIWLYLKKQTRFAAFLLAISLIELYQLVASVTYGGSWEFARHMIVTQTYLFFICFWWIGQTVSRARKLQIFRHRNPR